MGCLRVIAMAEIIPVEPDKVMLDWGMSFWRFAPLCVICIKGFFICFPYRGKAIKYVIENAVKQSRRLEYVRLYKPLRPLLRGKCPR